MNCLNSLDRTDYFVCETACTNAKDSGREGRPFVDANWECTCEVCKCQCDCTYYRHDSVKLAKQSQRERVELNDSMKQTTMDLFVGFETDIHKHVSKRYKEIGDGNVDNVMGVVTTNLPKSRQYNIKMR